MTQYLAIKFRPDDERPYTYHHDGEAARVGDRVQVSTKRGRQTVEVIGISSDRPPFATKPIGKIVKRAKPEPEPMRDEDFDFDGGEP